MSGIKSLTWKEWRENFKWSALAALVLALVAGRQVAQSQTGFFFRGWLWQSQLLPVSSYGAPLAAALLGFLQIALERQRDQWAFLMHRPGRPASIFYGKVSVGLSLYLTTTSLALLAVLLWIAVPGHVVAPYDWRLSLPVGADILAGIPFYFGAMLAALLPARRLGSNALPLIAAVEVWFYTQTASEFWQAAVVSLVAGVVLFIAARGSFISSGDYEQQPKSGRVSLAAVLWVGAVVTLSSLTTYALEPMVTAFTGPDPKHDIVTYAIGQSGDVIRLTYRNGNTSPEPSDLNGKALPVSAITNKWGQYRDLRGATVRVRKSPGRVPNYRDFTRFNLPLEEYGSGSDGIQWYMPKIGGAAKDSPKKTRKLDQLFGPSGVTWVPGRAGNQFDDNLPADGSAFGRTGLFRLEHSLMRVDLRNKKVIPMIPPSTSETILGADTTGYYSDSTSDVIANSLVVACTSDKLSIFTLDGALLLTMPAGHPLKSDRLTVYVLPDRSRYFLWYGETYPTSGVGSDDVNYFDEVSPQGQLLHRLTIPVQKYFTVDTYSPKPLIRALTLPSIIVGAAILSKPNSISAALNLPAVGSLKSNPAWQLTASAATIGLLMAILTFLIGSRNAWSQREKWLWSLLIFFLGLPGLLMLLALRGLIFRQACSSCGRKRVVNRAHCEHCGAAFPPPPCDGTEIFDAVAT